MNLNIGNNMNAEEKVKAYDEALERAKIHYETTDSVSDMELLELIFPNIRENEDERIRQKFIKLVKMSSEVGGFALHKWEADEMLAWLEEQGKQKSIINVPTRDVILSIWDLGNEWKELTNGSISTEYGTQLDYIQKHWQESEYYLRAKQGEQKSSDKVEPKFKVGDWITNGACTIQITSVDDRYYWHDNDCVGGDIESIDKEYHLWSIQDAKDGDVLCDYHETYDNPLIFILKKFECVYFGLTRPSDYSSYCFLTASDRQRFKEGTYHHEHNIRPATKEQRTLLFQKMKEAAYEWDAENKELKKIEQKPACSDDKKLTDVNHEYFSELLENNDSEDINDYAYQVAYCMSHDWIEETATWDDVQKACKLGAKWQEKHGSSKDWNEEDETNSYHLKTLLENLAKDIKHEFRVISDNDRDKYTAWLESLKYRARSKQGWSEEDGCMLDTMEGWLDTLCEYLKDSSSEYIPDVESCINWLKSLKQKIGG